MPDKKIFTAQAFISKISTMDDKTLRVSMDCQEMSGADEAVLFSVRKKAGWFLFSEQEIKQEDVANLPDIQIEKSEKHPSQRLRACIWRLWELTDRKQDFEVFYRLKMDKIIEWIKTKLN